MNDLSACASWLLLHGNVFAHEIRTTLPCGLHSTWTQLLLCQKGWEPAAGHRRCLTPEHLRTVGFAEKRKCHPDTLPRTSKRKHHQPDSSLALGYPQRLCPTSFSSHPNSHSPVVHLTLLSAPQEVLAFSNSSARGRAFLKHLTDLSIHSTLFVPQNSGLQENKVSGVPSACTLDGSVLSVTTTTEGYKSLQ